MMRITLFLALSFLATSANALLINGDFETGNLNGWSTFTTANGTIGTPGVSSFDVTGSGASLAAVFNVGNVQNPGNNGGGLFQAFNFGGGSLSVSVDIASSVIGSPANGDAGEFSLQLDGVLIDFLDFGGITAGTTERGTLSGIVNGLLPGSHEFRVLMTRSFETSSGTPLQYIDNAVASGASGVPTPGTLALFGLGLAGLGWLRRKQRS